MLGLTDAHRRDIRRAFDLFDQAGHGVIDVSALRMVFRALGFELGHDEVRAAAAAEREERGVSEGRLEPLAFHPASPLTANFDQVPALTRCVAC